MNALFNDTNELNFKIDNKSSSIINETFGYDLHVATQSKLTTSMSLTTVKNFNHEDFEFDFKIENMKKENQQSVECSPYTQISDVNKEEYSLYWIMLSYDIFSLYLPMLINMIFTIYLIKKRSELKVRLEELTILFIKIKIQRSKLLNENNTKSDSNKCDGARIDSIVTENLNNNDFIDKSSTNEKIVLNNYKPSFIFTEFHIEFLKTCSSCIASSITHFVLMAPYNLIYFINSTWASWIMISILRYLTYMRYIYFGSKFYLFFLVSYKFRRELSKYFNSLSEWTKKGNKFFSPRQETRSTVLSYLFNKKKTNYIGNHGHGSLNIEMSRLE